MGVVVTQGSITGTLKTALQNEWTLAIAAQTIAETAGVTVSQNEWTLAITSQAITEIVGVTVSQNEWTLALLQKILVLSQHHL